MSKMIRLAVALLAGSLAAVLPFAASADEAAPAAAAASPLLSATGLQPLLEQPDVRVLDIRAPQDYAAGHIPGAVNTPYGAFRGPADNAGSLRTEGELTELLRKAGIDGATHVIVAHAGSNQTDFGAAARVYWTLKVGGLSRLSVLDGGTQGWQAAGGALETAAPNISPSTFSYRYNQDLIVHTDELAEAIKAGKAPLLLDARPASFFNGEQRVDAAARYGTLPGAQDLEHAAFFGADGKTLKSADELLAIAQQAGVADTPVVSFCNTGHWAATNWFVLSEIAGNEQVRLYPESMVEWSKTDLPMANQPSRINALVQDAKRSLK
jgi:thiosulfate/3-mercaptopyruvate sulfurtransferase